MVKSSGKVSRIIRSSRGCFMKKVLLIIGLIILFVGGVVFYNKLYYPMLPIENMSKKEVLEKVNDSDNQIIQLSKENNIEWYIIKERNISDADEMIIELVSQKGWMFKEKEGSGLFFEKEDEKLIVTTQKWTSDYLLVKIPFEQ